MFFYRSTRIVSSMARVLNKNDDAARYAALADSIRAAFAKAYVKSDGRIEGDTQAGYALAYHFGLLPDTAPAAAVDNMTRAFDRYNGQISTGFHSTLPLMHQLSRLGANDHAYRLLLNRKMPSWGYEIDHGATTIWERWDGYVEGRGFQNPGMNSFAHYAIGAVGEWMFGSMLGIAPASPGFAQVAIAPRPGPGVESARGTYRSIRGSIGSSWSRTPDGMRISVSIPPNTTATVRLPGRTAQITESGKPLAAAPAVQVVGTEQDAVTCRVGSGTYEFLIRAVEPAAAPR